MADMTVGLLKALNRPGNVWTITNPESRYDFWDGIRANIQGPAGGLSTWLPDMSTPPSWEVSAAHQVERPLPLTTENLAKAVALFKTTMSATQFTDPLTGAKVTLKGHPDCMKVTCPTCGDFGDAHVPGGIHCRDSK